MLSIHVFSLRGRFSSQFPQFCMPSSVPQLVSYFDYFTLLCQIRSHSPTKRLSFSRPTEVTTEISLRKSQTVIKISLNFQCEVHFELYVLNAAYHNAPYWDSLFLSSYYLAKKNTTRWNPLNLVECVYSTAFRILDLTANPAYNKVFITYSVRNLGSICSRLLHFQ